MVGKLKLLATAIFLATLATLLALGVASADQGKPGKDAAAGATSALENRSDSPYLRLPENMLNWPSVREPEPRTGPARPDDANLVMYDVAAKKAVAAPPRRAAASGPASTAPFAGLLQNGVRPESIIGSDDRTQITGTYNYPWRTIGRLFITAADSTQWMCSGAVIGRSDSNGFHVLTAGHCVYMADHGGWVSSITFVPGLDGTYMPYNYANSTDIVTYNGWINSQYHEYDMAWVTLDRRVGNYTGWMGRMWASYTNGVYTGALNTSGYPADKGGYTQWFNWNYGRTATEYNHWYYMDTMGGQSGSPVWVYYPSDETRYILTVHAYGDDGSGSNHGTRLNEGKFNDIISWIDSDPLPTDRPDMIDNGNSNSGFTPGPVIRGQSTFSVYNGVRNVGTAATGSYCVGYYASLNNAITTGDYLIGQTCGNTSLSPFNDGSSGWSGIFPSSVPAGTYYVGWIIDPYGYVTEFDETNNTGYKSTPQLVVLDPATVTPTRTPTIANTATRTPTATPTNANTATRTSTATATATQSCGGWIHDPANMYPPSYNFYSASFATGTDGWAVGGGATLYRFNGAAWTPYAGTPPTSQDLYGVWMVSPTDGWAVGLNGTILRYNGSIWQSVTSPTTAHLYGVAMVSATDGWAVGSGGTILRWNGTSWQAATSPTSQVLWAVTMLSATDGWAVGDAGTILRWNGTSWQAATSNTTAYLYAVSFSSPTDGWAVGSAGAIMRYAGGVWAPVTGPIGDDLNGVLAASSSGTWAVASGGRILKYVGGTWVEVPSPTTNLLWAVVKSPTGEARAVGFYGTIIKYTADCPGSVTATPTRTPTVPGGSVTATGTPAPTPPNDNWANAINLAVPTQIATGNVGATTQTNEQAPCAGIGSTIWYRITPSSAGQLFAATEGNSFDTVLALYSGTSFTSLALVVCNDDYYGLASRISAPVAPGMTYYLQLGGFFGNQGTTNLMVGWDTGGTATPTPTWQGLTPTPTIPGGLTPTATPTCPPGGGWIGDPANINPTEEDFLGLGFATASDGWAVGTHGAMYRFNGTQWLPQPPIVPNQALWGVSMLSSYSGWAVGTGGTILNYSGPGAPSPSNWVIAASPTTSNIYGISMVSGTDGWAVGAGGQILRYIGTSWQSASSPSTADLWAITMLSSTDGWIVGNGGTILHYNGTSWQAVTSGTSASLYAVSFASPTEGWAVGSGGAIVRYSGGVWALVTGPISDDLNGVLAASPSGTWAVANYGRIIKYVGGAWVEVPSPTMNTLWAIGKSPAGEARAVGFYGTIIKYTADCPGGGTVTVTPTRTPTLANTATATPTQPAATATATAPAYDTRMGISPGSSSAVVNVPVTVSVVISNVNNLGGFQFRLSFISDTVQVQDITLGPFPGSTGRTVNPLGPTINNNAGYADFGGFSLGSTPAGPNGTGVIARVRLLPRAAGTTPLSLLNAQATDIMGAGIPLTAINGQLTVRACIGDLDGDLDVDILDVQSVAGRWNTAIGNPNYDARFDLDNDGDIDILDVQTVAGRWNTTCQ